MILNRYKLELTTAPFPRKQLEEGFNLHRVVLLAPSILNIESLHAVRSNTWEPGAICKSLCSNRFESFQHSSGLDGPPSVEVAFTCIGDKSNGTEQFAVYSCKQDLVPGLTPLGRTYHANVVHEIVNLRVNA